MTRPQAIATDIGTDESVTEVVGRHVRPRRRGVDSTSSGEVLCQEHMLRVAKQFDEPVLGMLL